MIAPKLRLGDKARVVAPARSLALEWIDNDEVRLQAQKRFYQLGLELSFGKRAMEIDEFNSSTIESRVADLHEAFSDPKVKLIISVIGGYNSNQLLRYLDYDLIKANPKILCGYSDITALENAIFAKTGLATYSGPHYFTFGDDSSTSYSLDYFNKCLFSDEPILVDSSAQWSEKVIADNQWQEVVHPNEGHWRINTGKAEGTIIGGNQSTLNLLQGTEFMPSLENTILFLEYFYDESIPTFDRDLQSLCHQPGFEKVQGMVLGRFKSKLGMTQEQLAKILLSKKELRNIPILANVDFGHTYPMITFPIGGTASLRVDDGESQLIIFSH